MCTCIDVRRSETSAVYEYPLNKSFFLFLKVEILFSIEKIIKTIGK